MSEKLNVRIREAVKLDLPAIIELMKALTIETSRVESTGASTFAEYEKVFDEIKCDPHRKLFVAEVDGQVVGAADLLIEPNLSHRALSWAIVENVVVDESMRRKGVGRKLVKHLIETAKQNRCYKIGLSSNKKRTAAHRLYESLGFAQYGLGFRIYF
jgi:GNAT superfamily N-acetyltransferase